MAGASFWFRNQVALHSPFRTMRETIQMWSPGQWSISVTWRRQIRHIHVEWFRKWDWVSCKLFERQVHGSASRKCNSSWHTHSIRSHGGPPKERDFENGVGHFGRRGPAHSFPRASVMKTVPHFLRGPFRNALKLAWEEAMWGNSRDDEVRQERGWKFLMLLPRMLLHRAPGGGLIVRAKLVERFEAFAKGEWEQANSATSRQPLRDNDSVDVGEGMTWTVESSREFGACWWVFFGTASVGRRFSSARPPSNFGHVVRCATQAP